MLCTSLTVNYQLRDHDDHKIEDTKLNVSDLDWGLYDSFVFEIVLAHAFGLRGWTYGSLSAEIIRVTRKARPRPLDFTHMLRHGLF